jgi:hypothetical protein
MGATVSRLEIEKHGGLLYRRALCIRNEGMRLSLGISPIDQRPALCVHGDEKTGIPSYHDTYYSFTHAWTIGKGTTHILQFSTRTLHLTKTDSGAVLVQLSGPDLLGVSVYPAVTEFKPFGLSETTAIDAIAALWQ